MEDELRRMQVQLDKHAGQIAKLFSKIDDTNKCIAKINTSLLQIKWGVYGAIIFYVVVNVGLMEAIGVIL
jgi:hypothetical protein|tara:strand:- start:110 stop:319 length:210 start_codon:yes stop_codon:yes gene_type:complete